MSDQLGLQFKVLSDTEMTAIRAYGVRHQGGSVEGGDIARPATFLIDTDGVIRWRDLAESWRIRVRPARLIRELERLS